MILSIENWLQLAYKDRAISMIRYMKEHQGAGMHNQSLTGFQTFAPVPALV